MKRIVFTLFVCLISVSGPLLRAQEMISLQPLGSSELATDWKDSVYTAVTGAYINSNNFDGGGVTFRIGYNLRGPHNIEVEIDLLFEQAKGGINYGTQSINASGGVANIAASRTTDLDMFPIMLNYRYVSDFSYFTDKLKNCIWYAGVGAGINIVYHKNTCTSTMYDPLSSLQIEHSSNTQSDTGAAGAAQAFFGLGYQITKQFSIDFGGRIFATQKYTFGGNPCPIDPTITSPQVSTNVVHWMLEAGGAYQF